MKLYTLTETLVSKKGPCRAARPRTPTKTSVPPRGVGVGVGGSVVDVFCCVYKVTPDFILFVFDARWLIS